MSSIELHMIINDKDANVTLREIQRYNDEVAREIARTEQRAIQTGKSAVRIARGIMGLLRSLMSAFGMTLNALGRSMLSVIDNIIALAAAWYMFMTARAAGGDLLAAFGLGTAALALGVSIGAAAKVAEGMETAEAQANKIEGVLSSVESLVRAPGRWGVF